jgi:hypothetical protein
MAWCLVAARCPEDSFPCFSRGVGRSLQRPEGSCRQHVRRTRNDAGLGGHKRRGAWLQGWMCIDEQEAACLFLRDLMFCLLNLIARRRIEYTAVFAACCCSREANDRQEFCWLGIAADREIRYWPERKREAKQMISTQQIRVCHAPEETMMVTRGDALERIEMMGKI